MTTYRIPVGTQIWRANRPLSVLPQDAKSIDWDGGALYTSRAVAYSDEDVVPVSQVILKPSAGWSEFVLFRLPPEAAPWTLIAVKIDYVVVDDRTSFDAQAP